MKFTKLTKKIFNILAHIGALGLLVWIIYPLAKFYFSGFSAFGDYSPAFTFADYIKNHLRFPPASWIYSMKTGTPLFYFYQWFHLYLMVPFTKFFGTGAGMEIYSFITLLLFYLFSYLLYFRLSRNHLVSAFLTTILYFSLGVNESLLRAGFIAQNATQFMLPLSLWLLALFYKRKNKKFLILSGIIVGLSLMGHGISSFLIAAPAVMAVFFWWDDKVKIFSKEKIINTLSYILVILLVGFPAIMMTLSFQFGSAGKASCENETCVASFKEINPYFNYWSLYIMLAMAGIAFFWSVLNLKNKLKRSLPFLAMLGFIAAYLLSTHYKLKITDSISLILWPCRTVWAISLGMGAVAAALFGAIKSTEKMKGIALILQISITGICLGLIFWLGFFKPNDQIELFEKNRVGYEVGGPHIVRFTIGKYKTGPYQDYNISMILPEWLPADDIDYRIDQLWFGDFCVWPLLAQVPDVRSCAGITKLFFDDWRSWLTSAETDQLGEKPTRGQQRQSNINQSLFMFDWYAIRYINSSIDVVSKIIGSDFPYAPYIESDWFTDRHEERPVRFAGKEGASYLFNFWRIREEYISPIIKASNVPTVFFVGNEEGWISFVRSLGLSNTNSSGLVPVRGPDVLEDLRLEELKKFNMVMLYAYNYDESSKAWDDLEQYVKEGGTVFIDTGREVKDSENATLPQGVTEMPSLLPAAVLRREALGTSWNLQLADSEITKDIDVSKFGPLLFADDPWKLSYVDDVNSLREDNQVILKQSNKPILITRNYGQGKVVWSGMNLPYYALNYQTVEEAKLLKQIISWGVGGLGESKPSYNVLRPKPEKIIVTGDNFKGVILKENFDTGWKAVVNSKGAKIYRAGPDVMYIPVAEATASSLQVKLTYKGTLFNWFTFMVSVVALIISLNYVIFGSFIKIKFKPFQKAGGKIGSWWEDEQE
ncbi:hypothetical protein A3J78_01415 [Candidatus Beckwithbacteria bacterium RBG_13_35_6]|uniref:Membrane protein 6-pyruvoyl-tetrahydropterin synthase-related domain-containing protein n=1 Tax=Candidatus Beckwithbacteria bacterium RBG_13_35_6 TaxID=1797456 RepID=A0A1F5DDC9_9BACT|nr:MAG: hypothetical protein A3J78_01415 [Candidatus Beckwithbacteria bacterium RBG_13_35_6]